MSALLPSGFVLDAPTQPKTGAQPELPKGFQLDPPSQQRRDLPLAEVPIQAVQNLPGSAAKFATGLYEAATNPVQTVTGIADTLAGATRAGAQMLLPERVFQFLDSIDNPETTQRISSIASAAGGVLADRYGSYERFKRTLAEDPVGAAADLSTILTGGALATTGRVSNLLARGAAATDPLMLSIRGGVAGVNAMRAAPVSIANAADKVVGGVRAATDPFYAPERVALNALTQAEDPQKVLNALRQTQDMRVTPGAPAPTLSERMIEAGQPSLALSSKEAGLAGSSMDAAQEIMALNQQRVAAIQAQLARIDETLQSQTAALKPADLAQVERVRADLLKQLADERQTLANTAQGVARPLPTADQGKLGGTLRTQAAKGADTLQKEVITPEYKAAFELAPDPVIDMAKPLAAAGESLDNIAALLKSNSNSEGIRKLFNIKPATAKDAGFVPATEMSDWGKFVPRDKAPPTLLTLEDFDAVRKVLSAEQKSARARGTYEDKLRANNLSGVLKAMGAALDEAPVNPAALERYDAARQLYKDRMLPEFQTGATAEMLAEGSFNMPKVLPSKQVGAFLQSPEAAQQFVKTFAKDPAALDAMQTGVLDLYRRNIVDAASRAVDPKKAARFEEKLAPQLDALEGAGVKVREQMATVRKDAEVVQAAVKELDKEATKFTGTKTSQDVADLSLKSPMDMKFVVNKLTPRAREGLVSELTNRAVAFLEKGDADAALRYLNDNAGPLKVALGKEKGKMFAELKHLAETQQDFQAIVKQAPKSDLPANVDLKKTFTPKELTDLTVVANDIKRMRQVDELGTPPDASVKQLASEQAAASGVKASEMPSYFTPIYTTFKNIVRRLEERVNRKSTAALIEMMYRDPDKLIPLLEKALADKKSAAAPAARDLTVRPRITGAAPAASANENIRNRMRPIENLNSMAR